MDELDKLIKEIRESEIKHRPILGYKTENQALKAAKKRQEGGLPSKRHKGVGPLDVSEFIGCSGWVYVSKNFGWLIPSGYCYREDFECRGKRNVGK